MSRHEAKNDFLERLATYQQQVLPLLASAVPNREPKRQLYDLIAAQLSRAGKGLRPALCVATCRVFGGAERHVLPSAAAIELLHNAFLIHDDIEDESEYRRGHPTLHRQYGIPLAVNAGDALNAASVRLLRQNLETLGPVVAKRVFDEFDHMSIETIEGQAMELGWIRDNDCGTSEDDYLLMVLKKTSWYSFIHPARIGALIAQPERADLDVFNRFGHFLGLAFQIQDDVLNLTGDEQKYGKEIGGDLLEGKRTLILTHLFKSVDEGERRELEAFFARPRNQREPGLLKRVNDLLRTYGSIEYAKSAAREFSNRAQNEFEIAYDGAVPGPDLDFLRRLLDYVTAREL